MSRGLEFYLRRVQYDSWLMHLFNLTKPFGVALCPFYLHREYYTKRKMGPLPQGIAIRPLCLEDVKNLCQFSDRDCPVEKMHERFERGDVGLGAWEGAELVGFTWASTCSIFGEVLKTDIAPHQAYLYDAYTAKSWRGKSLAPLLRTHLYAELAAQDRTELYSVTLVGNKSAKKFKEKLGAERVHTGLYIRFFRWRFQFPSRFKCFDTKPLPVLN